MPESLEVALELGNREKLEEFWEHGRKSLGCLEEMVEIRALKGILVRSDNS